MVRRLFIFIALLAVTLSLAGGVAGAKPDRPATLPGIKVIVLLKQAASGKEVAARLLARDATAVYRYHIIPAFSATVSQATITALRADPNVLQVVNDHRVRVPRIPTGSEGLSAAAEKSAAAKAATAAAPMESEALQLTHAQDAWNIEVNGQHVTGQGIRVGMLDSGTDPYHPDLAVAIEAYRDFTGEGLYDKIGHGTGTSSTVAAQGLPVYNYETGTTMRVSGMAPGAKVLMAKVIDYYDGWDSQIMRGIQWLVDQKVDIISCSLGALAIPQTGDDPGALAAQAAVDAGITFVNSEGNEGPGQGTMGTSPDAPGLLAVGASTGNREFSQIGFMTSGDAYKGDQIITWSPL
jgi:subtilisin family serine protease